MKTKSQTAMFGFFYLKTLTIFINVIIWLCFQKNYFCKYKFETSPKDS